jgi:hypothetical protein
VRAETERLDNEEGLGPRVVRAVDHRANGETEGHAVFCADGRAYKRDSSRCENSMQEEGRNVLVSIDRWRRTRRNAPLVVMVAES